MTPVDGGHGTLTVGSCAAEHHEPGQIRKAALSGPLRVTQGGLTRVHARHHRRREVSTAGAIIHVVRRDLRRCFASLTPYTKPNTPIRQMCSAMRAWPEKRVSGGEGGIQGAMEVPILSGGAGEDEADEREQQGRADPVQDAEYTVSGPGQVDHHRRRPRFQDPVDLGQVSVTELRLRNTNPLKTASRDPSLKEATPLSRQLGPGPGSMPPSR